MASKTLWLIKWQTFSFLTCWCSFLRIVSMRSSEEVSAVKPALVVFSIAVSALPKLIWVPIWLPKTWRLSYSTTCRGEKPKRISQLRVFKPALGAVWESHRTYLYRLPTLCLRQAWPLVPSTCRRRIRLFRFPRQNHWRTRTTLQVSLKKNCYKNTPDEKSIKRLALIISLSKKINQCSR